MSVRGVIPEHMQGSIDEWVHHGAPHPAAMGSFLRAVLLNDLKAAAMFADDENRRSLAEWAYYLHNEVPALAYGNGERLIKWHERGGLEGSLRIASDPVADTLPVPEVA